MIPALGFFVPFAIHRKRRQFKIRQSNGSAKDSGASTDFQQRSAMFLFQPIEHCLSSFEHSSKLIVLPVKDIYDIIDEFKKRPAQPLALATLVRVEGSSYRRPGARMLICEDGTRVGSLSAGCLEDEVALCAREALQTSKPTIVSFDTRR